MFVTVTRQLKYSGVLETVRIRKLGYSVRDTFVDFVRATVVHLIFVIEYG